MGGKGFAGEFGAGIPVYLQNLNVRHPVYPVGSDAITRRMSQKVAVFVVLAKTIGAGLVVLAAVFSFSVNTPVKVPEGNLLILGNGILNPVHIVVDGFVHALDPAGDQHISAHQIGIVHTAFFAELLDQFSGFLLREIAAGLNSINEQL